MDQISRSADYDQIARTFDKRYERNEYAGVARALREFTGNEHSLRVLEVGCGTGHWLKVLQAPGRHLTGLDSSAGMLAQAQKRVPEAALTRGTAEHLPLPANSFDRVFCISLPWQACVPKRGTAHRAPWGKAVERGTRPSSWTGHMARLRLLPGKSRDRHGALSFVGCAAWVDDGRRL